MEFAEYQKRTQDTAVYPGQGETMGLVYASLGLCGESGELSEKVKKVLRDDNGVVSEQKKQEMIKEAGDVLWYLARIAEELGLSLDEVAARNLEKLAKRKAEGKIGGSGDNR